MEKIFMNTENNKMSQPNKFVFNLSQILDFRNSTKYVVLQNLSIYCTCKNLRQQYQTNKLKIITPIWNGEVELTDGSYSV